MVASLSWPSRCMFLRYCLPSRAHARNSPFSRLLFCCCIGCLLSGRRGSLVFVRYASRCGRWSPAASSTNKISRICVAISGDARSGPRQAAIAHLSLRHAVPTSWEAVGLPRHSICYPAAKRFPASVPALSVVAGDTAGVSVCCRVYLLLIALIASAFGLDFCSGSSRHSSPTEQALPECDQRYRLMQQAICHVRDGLVSGRRVCKTSGPGVG